MTSHDATCTFGSCITCTVIQVLEGKGFDPSADTLVVHVTNGKITLTWQDQRPATEADALLPEIADEDIEKFNAAVYRTRDYEGTCSCGSQDFDGYVHMEVFASAVVCAECGEFNMLDLSTLSPGQRITIHGVTALRRDPWRYATCIRSLGVDGKPRVAWPSTGG